MQHFTAVSSEDGGLAPSIHTPAPLVCFSTTSVSIGNARMCTFVYRWKDASEEIPRADDKGFIKQR
ncbi:uncharacterized protein K460DRAFT_139521 [Cucurbitaria berberidis CBS 394.84]|uniref:Uncharacterized protein n=1 Tax=Cucurbitaria berberidis CBS 394.84 TaxID=1168544 RepID=A0A9P4GCP3_9PLEO|nr:uncharacterized protein K460DRAFT_139521 [Cucurbitaria berberidis CBS 394.84]KAF1843106.1 hypothetical protein K460DRAFT_139521 [Cucurbitaria berberidis CBS 394.84]